MDKKKTSRSKKPNLSREPAKETSREAKEVEVEKPEKYAESGKKSLKVNTSPNISVSSSESKKNDSKDEKDTVKNTKKSRVKDAVNEDPEAIERRRKEVEMLTHLKTLAETCIEVMRSAAPKPKVRRAGTKPVENNNITWSIAYRNMLDLPTFRLNTQQELVRELFEKFTDKILDSTEDVINDDNKGIKNLPYMDWMCNDTVEIFFGSKIPALKKKNLRLRISNAYSDAVALREEIDCNDYLNVNARAKAKGEPNYVYSEIIHYELLVVIIDALGKDHKNYKKLSEIASEFKTSARMDEKSTEDSNDEEGSDDMGKMISGITGEKVKTKDAAKIMKTFTRDGSMIKTMGDVFGEIKEVHSKNPNADPGAGMEEIIVRMAPRFAQFGSQIRGVMTNFAKDESSDSESSDSEDDVSDVSTD